MLIPGVEWEPCISAEGELESRRSREGYMADIGSCLEALRAGESYELCLTTALRKRVRVDPRDLYSELRASNPSAHAAWLSFGDDLPTVSVASQESGVHMSTAPEAGFWPKPMHCCQLRATNTVELGMWGLDTFA